MALRFPLLLMFIENCSVDNCLIMITAKVNVLLSLLKLSMPTGRRYLTSFPVVIDQKLTSGIKMIFVQNS